MKTQFVVCRSGKYCVPAIVKKPDEQHFFCAFEFGEDAQTALQVVFVHEVITQDDTIFVLDPELGAALVHVFNIQIKFIFFTNFTAGKNG